MILSEVDETNFPDVDTLDGLASSSYKFSKVEMSKARMVQFDDCMPVSDRKTIVDSIFYVRPPFQVVPQRSVYVFRSSSVFYMSQFGALVTSSGMVLKESFEEARWITPTKARLSYVTSVGNEADFCPPQGIRKIDAGFICMPLGATVNYGHYILDCLPSVFLCREFLIKHSIPVLMPRLNSWQKRHFDLLDLGVERIEIDDEVVQVESAYHSNIMNHFLHSLTPIVSALADRQLVSIKPNPSFAHFGQRIFIERDDQVVRKFSQEKRLIKALEPFGFKAVKTELLSVDDEIAVFAGADIVIGPIGAGFANILYCRPGSLVIEIIPSALTGDVWVRNICSVRRCYWIQIEIPSRVPPVIVYTEGEARPQVGLEYDPDYDIGEIITILRPVLDADPTIPSARH